MGFDELSPELPAHWGTFRELRVRRDAGVLTVGLDRPAKRNAIGVEMTLEIERLAQAALGDTESRVLVFHGCGAHFCAGMDMKDFFDQSERDAATLKRARAATDNWRARLLRNLPQVRIASVSGYCLGGALPILECADIVLADETAIFGLPEINFGFVPGGPIAKSARNALSVRAASYAALTGRPFDAAQGQRWGLVTHLLPQAELETETLRLANDIAGRLKGLQAS
jgi:trans-feruloyl-CoA hydratase/vanillin synthase